MRVVLEGCGTVVKLAGTPEFHSEMKEHHDSKCFKHANLEWRRLPTADGGYQVRRQCLDCGHVLGGSRKQMRGDSELPEVDESLADTYEAQRRRAENAIYQHHARLQHERKSSFFAEYKAYLLSEEWRNKRALVLRRCGGICEGCGINAATQVHHLTYEHKMSEFLFELVGICEDCHERLHLSPTEAPEAESEIDDDLLDAPSDWISPCSGCRFDSEVGGVFTCGVHDMPVELALSDEDLCGPKRSDFEECR